MMTTMVVIPARLESSRLKNKVLLELNGKTILQRVYEQASKAKGIDAVYIATDHHEILRSCESYTSNVMMTSPKHLSGTDRIAEAVLELSCDVVVNVQGDEPFISPELISFIAQTSKETRSISSAMCRIQTLQELFDPNVVKVVTNAKQQAMYFSRSVIPYNRDQMNVLSKQTGNIPDQMSFFKHIGIYGYTREGLLDITSQKSSRLEQIEKLEQLRVLEKGESIYMVTTKDNSIGIDTKDDYKRACAYLKTNQMKEASDDKK